MLHYFIWTIGCQMNKAESQRIASYLDSLGYQSVDTFQEADLIVLNTCVVRQSAENKVLGTLGLLKGLKREHPGLSILVTGCFVDSNIERLEGLFPHVDFFFKPGAYSELSAWIQRQGIPVADQGVACFSGIAECRWHRAVARRRDNGETPSPRALVPIIQGCNNFCSYCIVPYRRGREVSRPLGEVLDEVRGLVKGGVREITLLGQNVDSYGHDLTGNPDLADLLAELNCVDGLARIRFLTNHPKDMSQKLIEAMASLDRVCEHLDLAVQSGDNDILRAMRRGYTVEQFRELVHTIRRYVPRVSLSTDIIVGFPGETEEQFEHTFSLLEEMNFDVVHVAVYSPRTGTTAWREYQDNVPLEVKEERFDRVERAQANIAAAINSAYQDRVVEVLVEGKKRGKWYGRSRRDKIVFFENSGDCLGKLVRIRIKRTSPWSLQGELGYN